MIPTQGARSHSSFRLLIPDEAGLAHLGSDLPHMG
jgi:hypothetical protein